MSNLAYKVKHNHGYHEQPKPQKQPVVTKRRGITIGEKCLMVLVACAFLFGAVQVVSNQVAIYNANIEIQQMETKIENQTKANNDLAVQVDELSEYKRILAKAQALGLSLNENNVKVVTD